jgi:hypothetical protein
MAQGRWYGTLWGPEDAAFWNAAWNTTHRSPTTEGRNSSASWRVHGASGSSRGGPSSSVESLTCRCGSLTFTKWSSKLFPS